MESLKRDEDEMLRSCAELVASGQAARASYASGFAACARNIANAIEEKREPREEPTEDSTFRDPAARLSRRVES